MSRRQITHVNYGRHEVSLYHPRVDQLYWPVELLGAIMHHCTVAAKLALAQTHRALYRLLKARIETADIHLTWPVAGGLGNLSKTQISTLREVVFYRMPKLHFDDYIKARPPLCEQCGRKLHKPAFNADKPSVWEAKLYRSMLIYVGGIARAVISYMCDHCLYLYAGSFNDIATIRMRIVHDLPNFKAFYVNIINHYTTQNTEYSLGSFETLYKHVKYVFERKVIRKQQLAKWCGMVNHDFEEHLAKNSFPFYALKVSIFHNIIKHLSLRDIKSMKCANKLHKLVFRGAEIVFVRFEMAH
ncbi:hypothetical protein D5b_00412 [Faustovirus]|nr:hypothetical protein D5b_00412 [Faustovirus]